ncbi:alcohol dehydrogenase [bacterium]|nr:MAG: alcohol dehydrogenase [bacterium]
MKTHAAVLVATGRGRPFAGSLPVEVAELDLADPGAGEVLVRIASAGLCHSDLSAVDGTRPRPLPIVLGHEAAGVVERVGPDVTRVREGQRVVCSYVPICGYCEFCVTGRPALCINGTRANGAGTLLSGAVRFARGGERVLHHLGVSAFSEYTVCAQESLIPVPDDAPLEIAALFGCAALTGIGAVLNTAHLPTGSTVAIFGAGGVGLMGVLGANAAGALRIVVVDPVAAKRELARTLGATDVVDPAAGDPARQVRELLDGGAEYAFEMAGNASVLEQAITATRRGGTTVTVGLPSAAARASFGHSALVGEERTIKGSYMGSAVPQRDVPRYLALWRAGRLPIERLVSGEFALSAINTALDALASGTVARTICRLS